MSIKVVPRVNAERILATECRLCKFKVQIKEVESEKDLLGGIGGVFVGGLCGAAVGAERGSEGERVAA
jgi:outer membrane lipoprotein SlyB